MLKVHKKQSEVKALLKIKDHPYFPQIIQAFQKKRELINHNLEKTNFTSRSIKYSISTLFEEKALNMQQWFQKQMQLYLNLLKLKK
jgi:hypothetical protein